MSTKNVDADFQSAVVSKDARRSNLSMFMIMMGFTFFSASMWVGQNMAQGLDFFDFIWAMLLGGAILGAYTGALGYVGAKSGLSLDLLAVRSFGKYGSYLPSAMISFTQVGWFGVGLAMFAIPIANVLFQQYFPELDQATFTMPLLGSQCLYSDLAIWGMVIIAGICMTATAYFGIKSLTIISYIAVPCVAILGTVAMVMAINQSDMTLIEQFDTGNKTLGVIAGAGLVIGSFVSGGTATPNFSRFSKSGLAGCIITIVAFFIGNSLMFCFGAVSSVYVGGNDIFDVMVRLNLFYIAIVVLGLNIWTTNDNALYSTGLGLANITKFSKKTMVLVSGILGTVTAVWLYNNFCGFLNILNCTLPPVGIILVVDYFLNKKNYTDIASANIKAVNISAVVGVIAGAVVANLLDWGVASINGMVVAIICYFIGHIFTKK